MRAAWGVLALAALLGASLVTIAPGAVAHTSDSHVFVVTWDIWPDPTGNVSWVNITLEASTLDYPTNIGGARGSPLPATDGQTPEIGIAARFAPGGGAGWWCMGAPPCDLQEKPMKILNANRAEWYYNTTTPQGGNGTFEWIVGSVSFYHGNPVTATLSYSHFKISGRDVRDGNARWETTWNGTATVTEPVASPQENNTAAAGGGGGGFEIQDHTTVIGSTWPFFGLLAIAGVALAAGMWFRVAFFGILSTVISFGGWVLYREALTRGDLVGGGPFVPILFLTLGLFSIVGAFVAFKESAT